MHRFCVIFLFFSLAGSTWAQEKRCIWVAELNTPVTVDSLTIQPSSLTTESLYVDLSYDLSSGQLLISTERNLDSVKVCYNVYPLAFNKVYAKRAYTDTAIQAERDTIRLTMPRRQREEIFTSETLQKSGSVSRGVSFGNNQDVFVNSTLNLNLDGKLTDDLNIRASITDQNIPFQPEGNTQQLQDFDNVFIELYNERLSLVAGDVVLRQQPSHFLRYYKNVQGGQGRITYNMGSSEATSSIGISVAKGQFASVQVQQKEGVLGPYNIPGPEGQPFVIILANSERVFLDGQLLERGFNLDYTIDYNQAQITFTNRILITEFSRIRIDYEYSDQNYNRSIIAGGHEQQIGRLTVSAQVYREGDNRNRPLFGDLSNEEKSRLSDAGDDIDLAVTSGVDSVAYSDDEILYARRDTVVSGLETVIYEYSNDPVSARYRVRFSEVGEGQGNYVLDRILANGRVYNWVAPVNGNPQGNYAPVVRLPVPNKRQMITVGGKYKLNAHDNVFVETAFSDHDKNLYSSLDDDDNQGFAVRAGYESSGREVSFLRDYTWIAGANVEYDSRYFRGIDRFRPIEFNRNWNAPQDTLPETEKIINGSVGIVRNTNEMITYDLSYRNREGQVHGFQHQMIINQRISNWQLRSRFFHMNNTTSQTRANWLQIDADMSYQGKRIVPGYTFNVDKNQWRINNSDTSVMYYTAHTLYVHQGTESKWNYDIRYTYRDDERPLEGSIMDYSTSHTGRFQLSRAFGNQRINTITTYRLQELTDNPNDQESISSRLEWQSNWFNNHLQAELTYAVSNSQELRREFVFIRVPTGEGTHTWRDMNEDGIQDLNEFFLAINPDERNFAKIFVPTSEFVTAFQNLFVARIRFDFPYEWQQAGGLKHILSRFSNNTSWTSDNKIDSDKLADKLFAFVREVDNVLTERNIFRSTTFFNRNSSVYGMEFNYLRGRRQQLLTSGFEGVDNEDYSITFRLNPVRQYNLKLIASSGSKDSYSDFLTDRNYRVKSRNIGPQASWQPTTNFRLTLQYNHARNESIDQEISESYANSNELQFDLRYASAARSSFQANFRYINIDFQGEVNTPLVYELRNELQPGRNFTWNVAWQQRITKGLIVNLRYDGRSSGDAPVIHTGRVQVSALF